MVVVEMINTIFGAIAMVAWATAVNWLYYQFYMRPKWEREAIRRWYPPAGMGDHMFPRDEELDALAKRRELHDAGRLHPARDDAGAPARIHRARARGKRSTP